MKAQDKTDALADTQRFIAGTENMRSKCYTDCCVSIGSHAVESNFGPRDKFFSCQTKIQFIRNRSSEQAVDK